MSELAPHACIVCEKPAPTETHDPTVREGVHDAPNGWTYLANAKPVGAMACSPECTAVAIDRHNKTGRVDTPKEPAK